MQRMLIALSAILSVGACAAADPHPEPNQNTPSTSQPVVRPNDTSGLLSHAELRDFLQETEQLGRRQTGSPNHHYFLDMMERRLQSAGVQTEQEPWTFTRFFIAEEDARQRERINNGLSGAPWTADQSDAVKFEILDRAGETIAELPVAAYHPFSGATGPEGVEGEISINPFIVRDRIVVHAYGNTHPPRSAVRDITGRRALFVHDPDGDFAESQTVDRTPMNKVFPLWSKHRGLRGKSLGLITLFEDYPFDWLQETHVPHIAQGRSDVPGLLIDRDTRDEFERQMEGDGERVRITLDAEFDTNARSFTLVATVPGQSAETILLNAEADGVTAYQGTGAAVVIGILRDLAQRPLAERPRTVKAIFTTHYSGSRAMEAWAEANAHLEDDVVALVGLETMAGQRWIQDASGEFVRSDDLQPMWSYVSGKRSDILATLMREMIENITNSPAHVLIEDSVVFSESTYLHREWDLPVITTLSTPAYNISAMVPIANKIDYSVLYDLQVGYAQIIDRLMNVPRADLDQL